MTIGSTKGSICSQIPPVQYGRQAVVGLSMCGASVFADTPTTSLRSLNHLLISHGEENIGDACQMKQGTHANLQ